MYEAAWMGYYQQRRRTWLHSEPTATDSNSGFPFHLICRIETVAFLWPRKHDCYQPHVPPFRSHITALNGSPRESLDSQRLSASPRQPLPGKVLQAVSVQNRPSPADVTLTHTHTHTHRYTLLFVFPGCGGHVWVLQLYITSMTRLMCRRARSGSSPQR